MNELSDTLKSKALKGPVISNSTAFEIGSACIIAPHPDDESSACGGIIALLRQNNFSVNVIFITDGSMSHPSSQSHPPIRLKLLRAEEAINALHILGVKRDSIYFLGLPDSKMEGLDPTILQDTSMRLQALLQKMQPKTAFLPWRNDPHSDHIATWKLCRHAISTLHRQVNFQPVILEYLVWFWERTKARELDIDPSVKLWRVGINNQLARKKRAIEAHASQLGQLIKDDPNGFFLSPEMLKKFYTSEELFLEYNSSFFIR